MFSRNSDFVIPRFRTVAYGKHGLSYLGPVLWSKLKNSIWLSDSLEIFKKRIKQLILIAYWTLNVRTACRQTDRQTT